MDHSTIRLILIYCPSKDDLGTAVSVQPYCSDFREQQRNLSAARFDPGTSCAIIPQRPTIFQHTTISHMEKFNCEVSSTTGFAVFSAQCMLQALTIRIRYTTVKQQVCQVTQKNVKMKMKNIIFKNVLIYRTDWKKNKYSRKSTSIINLSHRIHKCMR